MPTHVVARRLADAFIAWTSWWSGNLEHLPLPVVFLTAFLHFFNGQHYNNEAIGGYYTWLTREADAKKTIKSE